MDTYSPTVITSNAAQKDYSNIQAKHSEILDGLQTQAVKVASYNQAKSAEQQQREEFRVNQEQRQQEANMKAEQAKMEMEMRQQELLAKL